MPIDQGKLPPPWISIKPAC